VCSGFRSSERHGEYSLSLAPLAQAKVYRDANKMHSKVFAVVSECGEYFLPGQDGEMYRGAHMLFCRNWWEQRKGINRGEQNSSSWHLARINISQENAGSDVQRGIHML
jgi:hypothetical protein